jgi:hypothetical protein
MRLKRRQVLMMEKLQIFFQQELFYLTLLLIDHLLLTQLKTINITNIFIIKISKYFGIIIKTTIRNYTFQKILKD